MSWEQGWENHQRSVRTEKRHYHENREKLMADPQFNEQFIAIVGTDIQGPYHDRDLAMSEGIVFADSCNKRTVFVTRIGHEDEEEEIQKALIKKLFEG